MPKSFKTKSNKLVRFVPKSFRRLSKSIRRKKPFRPVGPNGKEISNERYILLDEHFGEDSNLGEQIDDNLLSGKVLSPREVPLINLETCPETETVEFNSTAELNQFNEMDHLDDNVDIMENPDDGNVDIIENPEDENADIIENPEDDNADVIENPEDNNADIIESPEDDNVDIFENLDDEIQTEGQFININMDTHEVNKKFDVPSRSNS